VSRLVRATPAEAAARDALTFTAWGGGLTLPDYQRREATLRAHPWAARALRSWSWLGPDGVLASCETYQVASAVGLAVGHAEVVASVFTAPERRGRGYASALLRALTARGVEEGAQALVLFSEVGAALYERLGFAAVPSVDWVLPALPEDAAPPLPAPLEPGPGPAPQPGGLQLRREAGQVAWHLERERFLAVALGRRRPRTPGARLPGGSSIGWTAFYRPEELQVLWLEAAGPAEAAQLLGAAQRTAGEAGLARVRHWAAEGAAPPDLAGLQVRPRDDELPMFSGPARRWDGIERASWA
jgi:GNAT superfamily N-acetyltransferase